MEREELAAIASGDSVSSPLTAATAHARPPASAITEAIAAAITPPRLPVLVPLLAAGPEPA